MAINTAAAGGCGLIKTVSAFFFWAKSSDSQWLKSKNESKNDAEERGMNLFLHYMGNEHFSFFVFNIVEFYQPIQ